MRFTLRTLLKTCLVGFLLLWIIYFSDQYPGNQPWQEHQGSDHLTHFPHHHNHPLDDILARNLPQPGDSIYPNPRSPFDDRILAQMDFTPESVKTHIPFRNKVLLYVGDIEHALGTMYFYTHPCRVRYCELTTDMDRIGEVDVVLFREDYPLGDFRRPAQQIWVLYTLESPQNTPSFSGFANKINWTATYRRDSTLVTPYEKYVPINQSQLTRAPQRNYAAGKSRMVAWFVSNCHTANRRLKYVQELSQHVQVDIYGACGPFNCQRGSKVCSQLLNQQYKFYLAFENSNCQDYITEKFFITGLQHDIVPIVMGATPQEYRRVAPPHSFIHVEDFSSPMTLARYLLQLNKNDAAYNAYFGWKGLWRNIDTLFPCRLCALAHDVDPSGEKKWYRDVDDWWRGNGVCRDEESVPAWMKAKRGF